MSRTFKTLVRAAFVAAVLTGALGVASASAASPVGELTRFGQAGTGTGEVSATACKTATDPQFEVGRCGTLIGVDPDEENSVFVLDQPHAQEENEEEEVTRYFRIQKFTKNSKGAYEATANAEFKATSPSFEDLPVEEPPIEGIAVDPTTGRLFVLVSDARTPEKVNDNDWAAGELIAFSTAATGGKLTPEGKEAGSPVLVNETEFNTLTTKGTGSEETLLDPRGITVDPYKDEVIVLGHVRTGTGHKEEDEEGTFVLPEKGKTGDFYELERINETTGAVTEKYRETTGTLLDPVERGIQPDSPVVAGTKAEPRLYVNFEGLVEIPYDFSSGKPAQVFREQGTVRYPSIFEAAGFPEEGGSLSAWEGHIYAEAQLAHGTGDYKGIYERSGLAASAGEALEWTGDQAPGVSATEECVLEPGTPSEGVEEAPVPVAAGSAGDVFALAPEYLASGSEHAAIIEFGPGGKGCPIASTTGIAAYTASEAPVEEGSELEAGTKLTFKVPLTNADVRQIEWKITEAGKTETFTESPHPAGGHEIEPKKSELPQFEWEWDSEVVGDREFVEPELTKAILTKGVEASVEAVVTTDNGATPQVTTSKFVVTRRLPKATFESYKATVTANEEEDVFKVLPTGPVKEYEWNFGDGTVETLPAPGGEEARHTFTTPGTYTVNLAVKGEIAEETSEISVKVTVNPDKAEVQKKKEEKEQHEKEEREKLEREEHERLLRELAEREEFERLHDFALGLGSPHVTAHSSGAFVVVFHCTGKSSCAGKFTLVTAGKVAEPHHHGKVILKLGSGSFSAGAGKTVDVTVHLSRADKLALAHDHSFKVKLAFVAHDAGGTAHSGSFTFTLAH